MSVDHDNTNREEIKTNQHNHISEYENEAPIQTIKSDLINTYSNFKRAKSVARINNIFEK